MMKHRLSYFLRTHLSWSPRVRLRPWGWDEFFSGLRGAAQARALHLANAYGLNRGQQATTQTRLDECFYVLDLLDRHIEKATLPEGRCLDVGSKNGAYLPGLNAFLPGWDAVEIDAHRRYVDFTTRRAHGEAVASVLHDCRFIADSVTHLQRPYRLITWFLPFVLQKPHVAFGLPAPLFEPQKLLAHVYSLLAPRGALWVVNQGPAEAAAQALLFKSLGLPYVELGRIESVLSPFQQPRFGFRLVRQ